MSALRFCLHYAKRSIFEHFRSFAHPFHRFNLVFLVGLGLGRITRKGGLKDRQTMERIFYKSAAYDRNTRLPIYIFDTTFLPSPEQIDYDAFLLTLMQSLPKEKYVLVMFSCGLVKISWLWGIKFLRMFLSDDNDHLLLLEKVISVHDSWFIKSITTILNNYNYTKKNFRALNRIIESFTIKDQVQNTNAPYSNNLVKCRTLYDLHEHVDVTKLKISLNVYKFDSQFEPKLTWLHIGPTMNKNDKFNLRDNLPFYFHFYQIFNIVNSFGSNTDLIFYKPGNKNNTLILCDCVNRNQMFWINDWDLHCIAASLKRMIMELPEPLVPVNKIDLPLRNDYVSVKSTFSSIVDSYDKDSKSKDILVQLCDLCCKLIRDSHITKHTPSSISKSLSHSISQEIVLVQNRDTIQIIYQFFKNVLFYWYDLKQDCIHSSQTVGEVVDLLNSHEDKMNLCEESYDYSSDDENVFSYENPAVSTVLSSTNPSPAKNSDVFEIFTPESSPVKQTQRISTSLSKSHQRLESRNGVTLFLNEHNKKPALSNITNLSLQNPPQLYNFKTEKSVQNRKNPMPPKSECDVSPQKHKKPVIRGRKVGELAKLFDERAQGLEILQNM